MDHTTVIKTIFSMLDFNFEGTVTVAQTHGVSVSFHGSEAVIGCDSPYTLARGCSLLAYAVTNGKREAEIRETPVFDHCGVMLDLSRNKVMTVAAVKRFLDYMAAMGLNLLMLYTEDVYELEGYPYFGHLRGRYTKDELKEIAAYAKEWGIELIPCIQTLGHLGQFLQWPAMEPLKDSAEVLMVDEPKTYELIECMIRTCREIFDTDRIHIGMDESHGLGEGNYRKKHGECKPSELFTRHLGRVREICEKYGFRPMIWGDMFFRYNSAIYDYCDFDCVIPPEDAKKADGVDIVYWNFCHTDREPHDIMIKKHTVFSGETIFAGGVWTWKAMLPRIDYSYASTLGGLEACVSNGIKTVFAPMWGNSITGCYFLAIPSLAAYSEYCYHHEEYSHEEAERFGCFIRGISTNAYRAMAKYFYENDGKQVEFTEFFGQNYCLIGDRIYFCDPLYPMTYGEKDAYPALMRYYTDALQLLEGETDEVAAYTRLLFRILKAKLELYMGLRESYLADDRARLQAFYEKMLALREDYRQFAALFETIWMRSYKVFGYEVANMKHGGVICRLEYAIERLKRYLAGMLPTIEELEAEPLPIPMPQTYTGCVTPSINLF